MKKIITGLIVVLLGTAAVACIPEPAGFPLPGFNDGVPSGVTLTPYTGPTTITTAGTVIDRADIAACITVDAPNVHITRSRISCSASAGIRQGDTAQPGHDSTGLLVQDTEITSPTGAPGDWGVILKNTATLQRIYLHGTQRGVLLASNVTVSDSYIGDTETQALLALGGVDHVIIRHNAVTAGATASSTAALSALPQAAFGGANDDWLVDSNLFNSVGITCTVFGFAAASGDQPNTNFTVTGNRFGTALAPNCGTLAADSFSGLTPDLYATTFGQPVSAGGWGWTWGDHGAHPGALNTFFDQSGPPDASGDPTPGPLDGQTVLP